jgi:TetR/AcrR family tetracycline transcriptional repressor
VSQALPPPIWSRRTTTARPPVSEEAIVEAALRVLDDDGLDAVTMRAVAERMGVSAPTIYWHVENKDGLLDRLYDRLCSEVPLPSRGTWQHRLQALAASIRSVFAAHRDSARIAVGRFPLGPHGLQVTEAALAALADAGLDIEDTAHAAHLFFSYVTSFCYQETILPAATPTGNRAASLALVEHYLSSLPPNDFPHLTRCAQALSRPGLDRRFTFGLNRLIRGLTPP